MFKRLYEFLKHFFVPHKGNNHHPRLSHGVSVFLMTLAACGVLAFSLVQVQILNENTDFLSAVLPSVLVDLANEDRQENGSNPLVFNEQLQKAAQMKADHMAQNGYFAHVSPDGTTPWYWIEESGYDFVTAGENLAVHFTDSRKVEEAWMDSPTHRANILNHSFREVGIAVARGTFEGYETTFVVQMFGTPVSAATTAQSAPSEVSTPSVDQETSVPASEPDRESFAVSEASSGGESVSVAGAVEEQSNTVVSNREEAQSAVANQVPRLEEVPQYSSTWERILSQPFLLIQAVYVALALVILITLIMMLVSEARNKHPRHVAYLALSLVCIFVLFYVFKPLIFPEVLIAYF